MMLGNPVQELEANRRWLAVADENTVNVEVDIHSYATCFYLCAPYYSLKKLSTTARIFI